MWQRDISLYCSLLADNTCVGERCQWVQCYPQLISAATEWLAANTPQSRVPHSLSRQSSSLTAARLRERSAKVANPNKVPNDLDQSGRRPRSRQTNPSFSVKLSNHFPERPGSNCTSCPPYRCYPNLHSVESVIRPFREVIFNKQNV